MGLLTRSAESRRARRVGHGNQRGEESYADGSGARVEDSGVSRAELASGDAVTIGVVFRLSAFGKSKRRELLFRFAFVNRTERALADDVALDRFHQLVAIQARLEFQLAIERIHRPCVVVRLAGRR